MSTPEEPTFKDIISNITIPTRTPPSEFPSDVLKSMKANATPKQAIKLMKMNKFFIQPKCTFTDICENAVIDQSGLNLYLPSRKSYELDQLPSDLAICGRLVMHYQITSPQIISKIVIFDLKILLFYLTHISFDEFKILASSGNLLELTFSGTILRYKNDEIVPFEVHLDLAPKLQHLHLDYDQSIQMPERFIKKICSSNLRKLNMYRLTEKFECEAFLTAIVKKKPNLSIKLNFMSPYYVCKKITTVFPPNFQIFYHIISAKPLESIKTL